MTIIFPSKINIITAMKNPLVSYRVAELKGGNVFKTGFKVENYCGGFATVFPFKTADGRKIAVRCWHSDIGDANKRCRLISEFISKAECNYFVNFSYIEDALLIEGRLHPIVTMAWLEEPTLKDYIKVNLSDKNKLLSVAANFKVMVEEFHRRGIAHGDLSHGNIKVRVDGTLVVLDYDSMYVAGLEDMPDRINGQAGYQHPYRVNNAKVNQHLDYFSELVIYLSLLTYAEYPAWFNPDTDWLLFEKEDFENPDAANIFLRLDSMVNPTIKCLTKALKEFVLTQDICKLKPLEKVLGSCSDDLVENISSKF